jgi:hypothetical protein
MTGWQQAQRQLMIWLMVACWLSGATAGASVLWAVIR